MKHHFTLVTRMGSYLSMFALHAYSVITGVGVLSCGSPSVWVPPCGLLPVAVRLVECRNHTPPAS